LCSPAGFILPDIKKFQIHTFFYKFFSFDVALCQKVINVTFFKDLSFVKFCDEINLANFRKSPRKHQQGGLLQESYLY
jgi:hypothetical protein